MLNVFLVSFFFLSAQKICDIKTMDLGTEEILLSNAKSKIPFYRQAFVTIGVALNLMGSGCVGAFPAFLNPSLRQPDSHIHPTLAQESWIASIIGVALILGNILNTFVFDRLGRKKSHILSIIPILTGWFVLIFAQSVFHIILARFLQGISMGMQGALGSIIIGEMTHPKNRGPFTTLLSIAMTFGVLFTHTIGTVVSWQIAALICSFTSFISLIIIIYSPESPAWLISKGRLEESRRVFYWLRGNTSESSEELEIMIKAQNSIRKECNVDVELPLASRVQISIKYFRKIVVKPEFFKPIVIMAHLYILYQFAGLNVLAAYMTDIISQLGGKEVNAKFWMITLDIQRLVAALLSLYLVRIFKRRTLLFTSCSVCIITFILKALYLYLKQRSLLPFDSQWISISLISVYIFSVATGITIVPMALGGELLPLEFKNIGSFISLLILSVNFFLALKCFPILTHSVGLSLTYGMYACVVAYCTLVLYCMLPETKGKTLQEIEDGFRGVQRGKDSEPLNAA